MDAPGRCRALLGIVEYDGRVVHSPDSLARHPLLACLTWTDTYSQPLNRENNSLWPLCSPCLILFPKRRSTQRIRRSKRMQKIRFQLGEWVRLYPPERNGKCAEAAMKNNKGMLSQKLIC